MWKMNKNEMKNQWKINQKLTSQKFVCVMVNIVIYKEGIKTI